MAGASFEYKRLPPGSIRLLSLLPGHWDDPLAGSILVRCLPSTREDDKSTGPSQLSFEYEALSYVWGEEDSPDPFLILDAGGQIQAQSGTLVMRENLQSALRHLRRQDEARVLWCDRICINQNDMSEREHQVRRMADIYRLARRVIIWLGPDGLGSAEAMRTIRYTGLQIRGDPSTRTWNPVDGADGRFTWAAQTEGSPYAEGELDAVRDLVARDWFKRLWTRQEATLARHAVVRAGSEEVSWTAFISAVFFIDSLVRLVARGGDATFARNLFNIYELGCLGVYDGFLEILHACRAAECTLDVDRVYGILGLLSSRRHLGLVPDYSKTPKLVYQDCILEVFRRHARLDFLELCEAATAPTWVPDLQRLGLDTGLNTRVVPYCDAGGAAPVSLVVNKHDSTIKVSGVRCGVIGRMAVPGLGKDQPPEVLRDAVVQIVRGHMGDSVDHWDDRRLETLAKGLLGSIWFERTGRLNHASLSFAMSELRSWVREADQGHGAVDGMHDLRKGETGVLFKHISRVLFHEDSCSWVNNGTLGLGFRGCRGGDLLYAILGCRRLIALRKEPVEDGYGGGFGALRYRVVGKFDCPGFNDGEALLGELPPGWSASYQHGLFAQNRPKFVYTGEISHWQWNDPRLQDVALPEGWSEIVAPDGCPYWRRASDEAPPVYSDPRLTHEGLVSRGVKVETLVII